MIIVCDHCKTRFRLDDSAVPGDVFKAKCASCSHIFTVNRRPPPGGLVELEPQHILDAAHHRIFTICNQKGGVAKTSSCINLGAALAARGKKVLLVDFDVQANLTELLGCSGERCFFDVMGEGGARELSKAILKMGEDLWCLPSNSRMALFSKKYLHTKGFERILRKYLGKVAEVFDYVLIDTPPSLDFFTINALMASDFAIIPTQAEYLAVKGVGHVENIIEVLSQKTDHKIDYKVLITMVDLENTAMKVVRGSLQQRLGPHLFRTQIEYDRRIQESQIVRTSVIAYAPESKAARQYMALANELMDGVQAA